MDNFLDTHLEGSPITVKIDEDEFFHPKQYIQYTIRFTFSALGSDNNWKTADSFFTVTTEGLEEDDADQKFTEFYRKVMNQYREFVGETMGFMEYAKEIHQRLRDCQKQLKAQLEVQLKAEKTIKHGTRGSRYKRT